MNTLLKGTFVIGLVMSLSGTAAAVAGGPTLELTSSSTDYTTGDEITVNVELDTKTYDVTAAEIHVSYTGTAFQMVSFEPGPFMPVELSAVNMGAALGSLVLDISVGSGVTPAQGTGVAAVLTLRALEAGTHTVHIVDVTQIAASGEAGDVSDTFTDIMFDISGETASPSPTAAPGASGSPSPTTSPPAPSSVVQEASQVSTGPGDYTVIALLVGAIGVLLYAGYMSTDHFRRQDAKAVVSQSNEETDRFDFKNES